MKAIICGRIKKSAAERQAADAASAYLSGRGVEVTHDADIDWQELRIENQGYQGAYIAGVLPFDVIVIIEGRDEFGFFVTKGIASIAEIGLTYHKKAVATWRDGELREILAVTPIEGGKWGGAYAEFTLKEKETGL